MKKKGDPVKVKQAEDLVAERKEEFTQLGLDLTTKMILLNEKRVQILAARVKDYHSALKKFYTYCARELQKKVPLNINAQDVSTREFKQIIGDTSLVNTELTAEEQNSLIERLSTSNT